MLDHLKNLPHNPQVNQAFILLDSPRAFQAQVRQYSLLASLQYNPQVNQAFILLLSQRAFQAFTLPHSLQVSLRLTLALSLLVNQVRYHLTCLAINLLVNQAFLLRVSRRASPA